MPFTNFEEWFAIRPGHRDDDFWPGRLRYDIENGIELLTARFMGEEYQLADPTFNSPTITGYLDYSRPATLVQPFVQSYGGMTFGEDAGFLRTSLRIVVNGILKNVHIEDLAAPRFTGLEVDLPSLHAWVAPELVEHKKNFPEDESAPTLSLNISAPVVKNITLRTGNEATITSYVYVGNNDHTFSIKQQTSLSISFRDPLTYDQILRLIWRLNVLFNFMIGTRLSTEIHYLETIPPEGAGEGAKPVTAELWFKPIHIGTSKVPRTYQRHFTEHTSPIKMDGLLELCFSDKDPLFYLMNLVIAVEEREERVEKSYSELLGCIEDFDRREFGDGRDPSLKASIESLSELVEQAGNEAQRATLRRLSTSVRNELSLRQRLERLAGHWRDDGFRGYPDFARVAYLRNTISHGRGLQITASDFQEMCIFSGYLAALARYQIWRVLGFSPDEIAQAFMRKVHHFGPYIPKSHFGRDDGERA
ncbi:hypothetical protein [Shinella sp.]|uniref:ApeA N-terminal domain 1-containing protein n=1 Tax=Shinella sp. TaxID=1870904 RepID=UPI003D2BF12C